MNEGWPNKGYELGHGSDCPTLKGVPLKNPVHISTKGEMAQAMEFNWKFFMLGYRHAINTLQRFEKSTAKTKVDALRKYFEDEAEKAGLL